MNRRDYDSVGSKYESQYNGGIESIYTMVKTVRGTK